MIAVNFGFLYSRSGRFLFCTIVGFMSYSISFLGKFAMGALYGVMLFHIYLFYRFPRFEEYVRKTHYYEGRLEQARSKKAMKSFASNKSSKNNML